MGVRGLTTYIKANGRKFLKDHKLHNSYIILDGYNIATNLFLSLHSETAFGGNYDIYALHIKEFFKLLNKCQIKPLVLFDGGYERRKIRTVYKRMRYKIYSARNVSLFDSTPNFPLFMRQIFREVLVELEIPFAQCDFEADVEIAALARQLQCPVLSYDSDFFIFDVMYIPFPSLSLEAVPINEADENNEKEYYLKCKLYQIDYFLDKFGGLDRAMLPLLASLLGNDYINRSVFKPFFDHFKVPKAKKNNETQVRIAALLEWLRKETLETALCKILGRMKQQRRKSVAFKVNAIIRGYTKCSSALDSYLSVQTPKTNDIELDINSIINEIENIAVAEDEDGIEENSDVTDSECGGSEDENDDCESDEDISEDELDESNDLLSEGIDTKNEKDCEIPNWLLDSMRKGNIHSSIMDILTLRSDFCPIQVEDYSLPHSHRLSLPILSVIVGLLLGDEQRIRYWARNLNGRLEWFSLDSVSETKNVKFPCLELLNQIPMTKKRQILLETSDLEIDLDLFPSDWQLFVVAGLFWLKNMTEPVASLSHLHALVMCIVGLNVISSKIGCYRTKRDFMKKYSKQIKKLNQVNTNKVNKTNGKETNVATCGTETCINVVKVEKENNSGADLNNKAMNIIEILSNVTEEDCILMFESLFPFSRLSDQLKRKPKQFCIMSVHSFAQFQSCLHHIMLLNSVLDFPLKQCFVSKFYSGLFVYNVFSEFTTKKNIDAYVCTLFKSAPSLLALYKGILNTFVNLLPCEHLSYNLVKNRRKKKKVKCKEIADDNIINIVKETGDEEVFLDENNKFSLLAIT